MAKIQNDNTTPMSAKVYDVKISKTIPYFSAFYEQTIDVIEQCEFKASHWLDLGCGTGAMEEAALKRFPKAHFVLVDPSEKMLEQAKIKLRGRDGVDYILGKSTDIGFEDEFEVVTAIQSHHYMAADERKRLVDHPSGKEYLRCDRKQRKCNIRES